MRTFKRFTSVLALAFFVSEMLPDNWHDQIHWAELPLSGIILAVICGALFIYVLIVPRFTKPWLWAGLTALALMSLDGYLRGNIDEYSLKFFAADLYCFVSLLAGYVFACTRVREDNTRLVARIVTFAAVIIPLTYIGLRLGLVTTKFQIPGRLVSASIFNAVGTLLIFLPWASVSKAYKQQGGIRRPALLFLTAIVTGLTSATRTILIGAFLFAFLYLILKRRSLGTIFLVRLACASVVLLALFLSDLSSFGNFAFRRLNDTQLNEESRWQELTLWWPQVRGDIALGQGMGSRFVSNVVVDDNPLASATHIGILTFLMKGGVVIFFGCVVLPLLTAVRVLFSPTLPEEQRGAAASVLMFIGLSSLSGGWYPLSLFAYGLAIASMAPERKNTSSLSLRRQDLGWADSPAVAASGVPQQ